MLADPKKVKPLNVQVIKSTDDHVPPFYRVFRCDSNNVCYTLTPEINHWTADNPVLIVAPPGTGKTTFCNNVLIADAIRKGKNVIVISNRVALSTQEKLNIMESISFPMDDLLTNKDVREIEKFGSVCVLTYHRLAAFVNDPKNQQWLDNVLYVVGDEIHMVSSDCSYNSYCGHYLQLLTTKFSHAIRVYMTATPWDVLYLLAEAEKDNCRPKRFRHEIFIDSRSFLLYEFPSDYSHVNLKFFTELSDLKAPILAAPDNKMVVFVDSKAKGKAFAEELGGRALYLDADSKDTPEWNEVIKTCTFSQQVLVTTAALDSGLNLCDPALTSIAVVSDDRASLIQMLGRKRRDLSKNEKVNLYVCDLRTKTITERHQTCVQLRKWRSRYDAASGKERQKMMTEIWQHSDNRLRHYFHCVNGYLSPNHTAFFMLTRKFRFYERIISKEITFQGAVRGWLGIPEDPAESPEGQLTAFCEANLGIEMTEDLVAQFRELVIAAARQNGVVEPQPSRLKTLGREALNNRLRTFEFGYCVAKNAWIIEAADNN